MEFHFAKLSRHTHNLVTPLAFAEGRKAATKCVHVVNSFFEIIPKMVVLLPILMVVRKNLAPREKVLLILIFLCSLI